MRIGITGHRGFIGTHLKNYLSVQEDIQLVFCEKESFESDQLLSDFVNECDTIVHLAAMNRHKDPQVIYDANVHLTKRLVQVCELNKAKPHILMASSTQEENDNLYGKSKRVATDMLLDWAKKNDTIATSMIIPNVFGPFGKPYYNSVTATFCHQLVNGETPKIIEDKSIGMIYVNDLTTKIFQLIESKPLGRIEIPILYELSVSDLLNKLTKIKCSYFDKGVFPKMEDGLDLALFNTFRCYVPHDYFPRQIKKFTDDRGSFVEIVRSDTSGQYSFSSTVPGITRGNHFHTRKAERFAVISGKARIQLRRIDSEDVLEYFLDGESPSYVDMPIWYTHNITNIGSEELITLFWISEQYNPDDPDTYFVNL